MSVDIIPADERGEFRITDTMLFENDAVSLAAFEVLLREEANRRGLDLQVAEDMHTRDLIVRWRPHSQPTEPLACGFCGNDDPHNWCPERESTQPTDPHTSHTNGSTT